MFGLPDIRQLYFPPSQETRRERESGEGVGGGRGREELKLRANSGEQVMVKKTKGGLKIQDLQTD